MSYRYDMIEEELNYDTSSFVSFASLTFSHQKILLTFTGTCLESETHPLTGLMMMIMGIIFFLTEFTRVSSFTDFTMWCENPDISGRLYVRSGESLYLPCPNLECFKDTENSSYVWFRNLSRTMRLEQMETDEHERVHYHRSVLYIHQLTVQDTGNYITRQLYSDGVCLEFEIDIVVSEEFSTNHLYPDVVTAERSVIIPCPVCVHQEGTFIWYKDFSLIPNQESGRILLVRNASKESEGIYTCVCTWEHHSRKHNTSGSRRLVIEEQSAINPPKIIYPIDKSVRLVDMDTEIVLTCSVFTGNTGRDECSVSWKRNRTMLDGEAGYEVKKRKDDEFIHSDLIISKVSQVDFQSLFHCTAKYSYEVLSVSVTLKRRDVGASRLTVISVCACVVLLFVLVSGAFKMFAVDLVLFLRGIFKKLNRKEDGKVYDAFVIYQINNLDEKTEKIICDFVNGELLTVLEKYYSYKLYIHGRDDLPGEDCMNVTETKIQLSRRLIFIITPGYRAHEAEDYDVQVGLHHALVQGDPAVILIQLDEMKDYTHLPLGLQHLLKKHPPLLWRHGEKPASRFWKQVRYRMPVPSRDCQKITTQDDAQIMYTII